MSAIFTGLGSGLVKSSATAVGTSGTLGNAATGRASESLSVNAATGNLVISRRDEFLVGRSLDVGISRTYNSLAEVHDRDNNDKWQMSTARRVFSQSGALNAAGSTIKRVSGDGSVVTHRYETRGGVASYWATDGSGAHDRLWQSGGDWYWQNGTSRITERYDADPYNSGEFRIIRQTDKDGQSLVFGWSGSKLSYVQTNNSEFVRYTWSGNNLTSLKTEFKDPRTGVTRTETGTYYAYDGNGRLATVTVDLSPEQAGTSDGHKFTISYLYDSAGRVTRMTQSDGSRTDIAYTSGKVTKLTEHVGDGTTRITQFSYGSNYTNVTAPNGQVTRLDYHFSTKLLTKITAPAAYAGAAKQVQTFSYDSAGNLTQSVAPDGRVTKYTYDAMGNITKFDRPIGTDVSKWYDSKNNVIKELSYSANEASSNTGSYIRYAYDGEGHLRYKVTAEGHVTEYRYDSYGRLTWEGDYTKYAYSHSSSNISESGMDSWRNGLSDKTQVDWMNYRYDARGNLNQTVNYGSATSTGGASTSGELYSRTYLLYDQEGRLLTRYGQSESGKEQFFYDGMGRLISSSDSAGATTSVFFDDANTRTVMQMATGLTRTLVYNKAGDIISETESSVGPHGANQASTPTGWWKGNLSVATAGTLAGSPAYKFTVNTSNPSATHAAQGIALTAGETLRYRITFVASGTSAMRVGLWGNVNSYGNGSGEAANAVIISGPGRLVRTHGSNWNVEGVSATQPTTVELTRTVGINQSLSTVIGTASTSVAQGTNFTISGVQSTRTVTDTSLDFSATTNNKYDKLGRLRVTQDAFDGRGANYIIYDKAGRKVGSVDPARRLTEYFYDKNNRMIGTTVYYNAISTSIRDQLNNPDNTLEMSAIRPAFQGTYDVRDLTTYDANGRVAQTINGEGEVTSFKYDNAGRLIESRNHYNKVSIASSWRTAPPANPVSIANHSNDAVTRTFYDRDGNVRGMLNGEGYLTENVYDQSGQKIREIGYVTRTSSSYWASGTFNQLRGTAGTTNANNRSTRYVYNGRGQLRFTIDSANYVSQFSYNYAGKLTKTTQHINPLSSGHSNWTIAGVKASLSTNSNDRASTNYYDFAGRLWRTVEPLGLDSRMYFDHAGNVIKETSGNRTIRNWYDARGNLRFSVDPEGYLSSYLYNEGGQVTHERRHRDKVNVNDNTTIQQVAAMASVKLSQVRYTYDSQGRVIYTYDQISNRTRYAYRTNGQLAYTNTGDNISADRSQTYFYYDNAGRLTRRDSANGQSEEAITYYTYDGLGNQTRVTDGNGRVSYFTYDKRGLVLTEKNGAGNLVRYERNAFGDIVKTWDAKNVLASEHIYDKRGLITRSYDAARKITDFTYTQFGETKTVKDPVGAITTFTYDKLGQVKTVKDANNRTESYSYDAYGNQTSKTNRLGGSITYAYDKLNRMTSMNDANGIVTNYAYDNRGNLTQMIEASGRAEARKTTYGYDASNRMVSTSIEGHSGSYTTQFAYDARGNVTRKTAPDGGRTIYYYDDLDRVSVEINAVGAYSAYTYDDNGNVKTVKVYAAAVAVPSNGGAEENEPSAPGGTYRETRFDYDGANRMTKSHVIGVTSRYYTGSSLATYSGSTLTTEYVHDANGNVVKTIDPNGNTTWAYYDAMNRMVHQVDQQNFRTTWTYDAAGNVTREIRYATATSTPTSTTNVPGVSTSSTLDRRTDFTYDKMGNRLTERRINVKIHNGSGGHTTAHATISYQYNGLGQVTKKTEAVSGNVTDYTYNSGGRLTKETRAAFTDFNGQSVRPVVDYYYDGLGNLTRTRQGGATGTSERNTYYYYKKGMLDRMTDAEGLTRYFKYDSGGRESEVYYTRQNYYGSARTEGVKRTYDKLGRVVSEYQGTRSSSGYWSAVSPNITTTYNTFGQVATLKANNGATQQNVYDKAGRLERTNAGDGVWKVFAYDRNGNQTAAITSAGYNIGNRSFSSALGLISRSDVNITYTKYDKRGQALTVYETDRDIATTAINQTLVTERRYNAFGEVRYEKDALGGDIFYEYNTMGKVWRVQNPSVSIQNENGSTSTVRPTEHYYHDLGGRLVASRDANGNLTRLGLLNGTGFGGTQGLVTTETFADGGVRTTKYDIHGDARRIIAVADGRSTTYRTIQQNFDRMGRITQTWNRGTNLQDNYTYDKVGQQISHWNNVFGSGNREIMDYDAMGRMVSSRAFGGDTTTTTYTFEVSSNTNAVGNFGGWKEVTRTVANNRTLTEWSDLFERVKRKNDFGGRDYTYSYDAGGRMKSLTGNGGNQQYVYYNTGKLKSIANVTGVLNSQNFQELKTTYGYDKVGNLTSQKTTDRGSTFYEFYWNPWEPDFYIDTWNRTTQNMSATYDKLGRMKTWSEAGGGDLPPASMTWTYDANGNIRRSRATYRNINSDQSVSSYNSTQDFWYRYDSMNRVVTSRGILSGGTVKRGTNGMDIAYNKAGQRTSVTTSVRQSYSYWVNTGGGGGGGPFLDPYDDIGEPYLDPYDDPYGGGSSGYTNTVYYNVDTREDYTYDNGGRLKQVNVARGGFNSYGFQQAVNNTGSGITQYVDPQDYVTAPSSTGSKKADYSYDAMSRITLQRDYSGSTVVFSRNAYYNSEGLLYRDDSTTRKGSNSYRSNQYNYYNGDNTLNYSYTYNYKNNSSSGAPNTRTTNTYVWYDGAVQSRVDYDGDTGTSSNTVYKSTYNYDSFGVLQSAQINDGRPRSVTYINNAEGQVISRKERDNKYDKGDPSEIYYRFGGKELGRVGNNGTANVTYEQSIARRTANTSGNYGAFTNGANYGSSYADFGGDYDAINSFKQGETGGTYTVRQGETLQAIAMQLWGDSALWYKLAEANGLSGREPLIEGRSLVIPSGVQRVHHNSGTMKPYNPAEAIGDTSPTAAAKPKKKKCGVFGAILLAVVAVAVTIITAGAALAAIAPSVTSIGAGIATVLGTSAAVSGVGAGALIAAGAVGGAVGSIASQGLGVATGIQDKFSWKGVALSALSGAVGAAVGANGVFGENGLFGKGWVAAAARGSTSSATVQALAVKTGLQEKFSWVGVAAAGIGAGVAHVVGGATQELGKFGSALIANTASGIANAATRSALSRTNFGDALLESIPDVIGGTLGSSLAGMLTAKAEHIQLAKDKTNDLRDSIFGDDIEMTPEQVEAFNNMQAMAVDAAKDPDNAKARREFGYAMNDFLEVSRGIPKVDQFFATINSDPKDFSSGPAQVANDSDAEPVQATTDSGEPLDEVVVVGVRDYWIHGNIDRAGIFVGEIKQDFEKNVAEFVQERPGLGLALQVADTGMAVAAPGKYLGGWVLEKFETRVEGFVSKKMNRNDWSNGKSNSGGEGFVFSAKLILSGIGAVIRKGRGGNITRQTRNGYDFEVDDLGRATRVQGELSLKKAKRNPKAQREAGGADRLPDDHGGHFVGARFNGPGDGANLFPQNGNFNVSAYKRMENSWAKALEGGKRVTVDIKPTYSGSSLRPNKITVNYTIGNETFSRVFRNRHGGN
ncbi:DNA/RNA non-specific endonuclease [Parerythrobacter jejuensis]|uniref:LysM peptidoglycan-binding domain-containing protein n=1 Tax=Parerythrobacter jejuensis TaxID=795812 RepID=A0A845ATZ6_9SPHN|nr:DNA/RNA non-specific endonuclease [Parerythrobacter jejuensis]MXP31986.1 LysM peptidoglycan-binding domain-containing protein [Parerythrobacter jejuensis]